MHIGYDIDGVLTKRDYTHMSHLGVRGLVAFLDAYLPQIVQKWTLSQPLHQDIHIAQSIASQHTISIITARPLSMCSYTSQWLKNVAQIEYNNLYCVGLKKGFAERKLQIAQELDIDVFLDDTLKTIELFQANGINAHRFETWHKVIQYLDEL